MKSVPNAERFTHPIRAAEYLRMSTEGQQYSIANQQAAIREYAATHGFVIIRSYADPGKSGLRAENRAALLSFSPTSNPAMSILRPSSSTTLVDGAVFRIRMRAPITNSCAAVPTFLSSIALRRLRMRSIHSRRS